jgi:glycosyltransferase involved in cell wall biosynthesis
MQIKYAKLQERYFLEAIKHIDYFAFMTNALLTFYETHLKSSARYIHLPMTVDLSRFENVRKEQISKPYIAFAGSLLNEKEGIDILIRAFAETVSEYPDIELRIAGDYQPDVDLQKDMIKNLGITSKVFYAGTLSREQIPHFLCNAKVLAMARPDSHQAQGGFPTKLGEYLATGNPVCVTSVGEIPDYLQDNVSAWMAVPGDIASFTDALKRALSNDELAQQVGNAGYQVALTNFSKEIQAMRLKEFLENN